MVSYFVPFTADTPAERVREILNRAERRVTSIRGAGHQALELLHLLDQAEAGLKELRAAHMDFRAEATRLETVHRQLRRRQRQFLSEVHGALKKERATVQPDPERWWWFLDEAYAQQQRHRLRRTLIGVVAGALVLAAAWVVYDRFIAPPPNVRQAYQRATSGQNLAEQGDLRGALAEFEAAVALDPTDSENWTWKGILHAELNETDEAAAAFDKARSLSETELAFLLERGMAYLRIGDLETANADAEEAVAKYPEAGWALILRANIAVERGDTFSALTDLEEAAELAAAADDTQLEAYARTQRAMVLQLQAGQMMPPNTEEPESNAE
jgi:tetratricopeptide (TPR) repeat protein